MRFDVEKWSLVDDEDRENEGDYICAAQLATAETINFMLSGHGKLCAPVLAVCDRLDFADRFQQHGTTSNAFMTPWITRDRKLGSRLPSVPRRFDVWKSR